jgi:hypothetical protein
LEYGLCFCTTGPLGPRVERSITTYRTDDNPIFSEMSANESLNICAKDLREYVQQVIGTANFAGKASIVSGLVKTRLAFQVTSGIIKAFQPGSVAVIDLGDRFDVQVQVAVIEPTNFVNLGIKVTRE